MCYSAYLYTCILAYLYICLLAYLHTCILASLHTCKLIYLPSCILVYLLSNLLMFLVSPDIWLSSFHWKYKYLELSTSITRTPRGHLVFSYFDNIRLLYIWKSRQRIKEFSNFHNLDDQSWNYFAQTKFFLTSFHSDIILLSIPYMTIFLQHSTRGQHVPDTTSKWI